MNECYVCHHAVTEELEPSYRYSTVVDGRFVRISKWRCKDFGACTDRIDAKWARIHELASVVA